MSVKFFVRFLLLPICSGQSSAQQGPSQLPSLLGVHNESSLRELTQALCIAAIGGVYLYNAQKLKEAAAMASNASSTNLEEEQHLLGLRSAPIKHKVIPHSLMSRLFSISHFVPL